MISYTYTYIHASHFYTCIVGSSNCIILGTFAYIDAASAVEGDVAAFEIDGPSSGGDVCMTFYRHMYGDDIGRLYLQKPGESQAFYEVTGGTVVLYDLAVLILGLDPIIELLCFAQVQACVKGVLLS